MKTIWVTGSEGQLSKAIRRAAKGYEHFDFVYTGHEDLDITHREDVLEFAKENEVDIIINCGAYTRVDQAESEPSIAWRVNAEGPKYLAEACGNENALLIHFSTDFVFDGTKNQPYEEEDPTNPLGEYGKSKLQGEHSALRHPKTIVLRTSWVYSMDGHNFLNTMLKLGKERDALRVVYDQIGTPTLTDDLAQVVFRILNDDSLATKYGLYHFSNEGVASWYDFAHAIMELAGLDCKVSPIKTAEYPTPARRPHYSVLHKGKIKEAFDLTISHWRESLARCLGVK